MNRLEAENGKYDGTGVDGGKGVAAGDDDDVFDTVFGRVVIGAKAYYGAESQAERVKHL